MRSNYRRYDWRLRNLVVKALDATRVAHLDIPKLTVREWIKRGPIEVAILPEFELSHADLLEEVHLLRSKVSEL